ncbi:MAG: TetR family transcriptional regulator C-terminal domain-containing protein [Pedobacter sp.]|jgi:hypothetical protein
MKKKIKSAAELQSAYIDYVLTHDGKPASVYLFAKDNGITEAEFYNFYGSFEGIEQSVWSELISKAIEEVRGQEIWSQYSSREKALAFFYAFIELLKSQRSFVIYSLKHSSPKIGTPDVLTKMKEHFDLFVAGILDQGIESGELATRRFLSAKYKDALWVQLGIVLNFWIKDNSSSFEKTDEAIERGVNLTFDLFQKSPLDSLFEYGKFMMNNGGFKSAMKF